MDTRSMGLDESDLADLNPFNMNGMMSVFPQPLSDKRELSHG